MIDFGPAHSQNRAVEINVFAPGQLGMKTGADFQERTDATVDLCMTFGWLGDARENFQQRALPRSVSSDDADDFTPLYFERNVV